MNLLADASLPGLAQAFPKPFHLTLYHHLDEVPQLITGQHVLVCRANLSVNRLLLENQSIQYVATASSGTDHLDLGWLASQNIDVIDAKGCNARAVADYVSACLAYLRKQQLVQGNLAGIIGMGKVGTQVQSRLMAAGLQVITYDPLKELRERGTFQSCQMEALYQADLLCIHAELHNTLPYPSLNLVDAKFLQQLKPGCIIINAARGGIINEEALLAVNHPLTYCTDVYLNEPQIDKQVLDKATLCTPHIAGHSLEAKYVAVAMVSKALHQILQLPAPEFAMPATPAQPHLSNQVSWEENILRLYNPFEETCLLKEATDIKTTFLTVRKAHSNRHDFCLYENKNLNNSTKRMLGYKP